MGGPLQVGAAAARVLSLLWRKPLIAVNHCVTHIEMGRAGRRATASFPGRRCSTTSPSSSLLLRDALSEAGVAPSDLACVFYTKGPRSPQPLVPSWDLVRPRVAGAPAPGAARGGASSTRVGMAHSR
jgi:tRNA A37 threonylcarbamoyltransferase TsaD